MKRKRKVYPYYSPIGPDEWPEYCTPQLGRYSVGRRTTEHHTFPDSPCLRSDGVLEGNRRERCVRCITECIREKVCKPKAADGLLTK